MKYEISLLLTINTFKAKTLVIHVAHVTTIWLGVDVSDQNIAEKNISDQNFAVIRLQFWSY